MNALKQIECMHVNVMLLPGILKRIQVTSLYNYMIGKSITIEVIINGRNEYN